MATTRCLATKVLAGNTVVLNFEFRDWHDINIPVENIHLKVFDINDEVYFDEEIIDDVSNIDVGKFSYIYTMPIGVDSVIVEVSTNFEGYPILLRRAVKLITSRN